MNKKLASEEKYKFNHAWKTSSLVEDFGKLPLLCCLDGMDIDTVSKNITKYGYEKYLFKQIYEEKRQYVVTSSYGILNSSL